MASRISICSSNKLLSLYSRWEPKGRLTAPGRISQIPTKRDLPPQLEDQMKHKVLEPFQILIKLEALDILQIRISVKMAQWVHLRDLLMLMLIKIWFHKLMEIIYTMLKDRFLCRMSIISWLLRECYKGQIAIKDLCGYSWISRSNFKVIKISVFGNVLHRWIHIRQALSNNINLLKDQAWTLKPK